MLLSLMEQAQVAYSYMYAHSNYIIKALDTKIEQLIIIDNEIIK